MSDDARAALTTALRDAYDQGYGPSNWEHFGRHILAAMPGWRLVPADAAALTALRAEVEGLRSVPTFGYVSRAEVLAAIDRALGDE